ncbi:MAG: DUF2079 domain-containing protein [Acidimicrobiales bacterium]
MITAKALRRRLDYQVLRWQARLDGTWADRVLPLAAAAGVFVLFVLVSLARARSLATGTVLADWVQGAWLITEGRSPDVTIGDANLIAAHGSYGFLGVAQLTRLFAPIPTLLVLQSLALASSVFPIWRIARNVCSLRVGGAAVAVAAFAAYPPLHQLNLADFSPEALAVPALLTATYAGLRQRWWWALGFFVVALSMSADLGLTVAALAMVLVVETRSRRAPWFVVLGIGWMLVSTLVVQPRLGDRAFLHPDAFARYGDSPHGVVWGMVTDPLGVLGDLLAEPNFVLAVAVLAPVAFVPLLVPRLALPITPVVALLFVADAPLQGLDGIANLVPVIVFTFVVLPFALAKVGRRNIERITVDRRILGGLCLAAAVFFVLDSPTSPYARPWEWGGRSLTDQARLEAIALVEPGDAVRVAVPPAAELASRRQITVVPDLRSLRAEQLLEGEPDVILLDPTVTGSWSSLRRALLAEVLEAEGFERVYARAGVELFARDGRRAPEDDLSR